MRPVTDPGLLAELESDKPVTDPSLLAELEGTGDFSSVVGGSSTSIAPPDYSGVFRDDAADNDGFGNIALRAIAGRVPELVANAIELPANANEALTRALSMEPSPGGLFGAMRGALRNTAGAVRDLGYTQGMDAAGYGQPTVSGTELVESLTPSADIGIGERMGRIARFIPETLIASTPDMAATLNPATLAAYIGSRTNEIATNRAANDRRQQVELGDLAVGGVAAPLEALLERFTTMRLLPQGTSLATPGVREALARIAKETGLQGALGGVEEVIPYLGETLGTETGATKQGALESFVGGLVAEGALGGVAKGANEAGALLARGAAPAEAAPTNTIAPEVLARGNEALAEAQPAAPDVAIAPEPTADLDQLLASIPPEVVAELLAPEAPQSPPAWRGGENVQAPPVAPQKAEAINVAPYQAPAAIQEPASTEATQTPEQSGQVPAEQSAPAPSGADLVLPAKALRDQVAAKVEPAAPADDTPDPPLDIRYGKARKAPAPMKAVTEQVAADMSPATDPASWVIREKVTGKVIAETFDRAKVDALNTERYEAVPALQHLQEINTPDSMAYRVARGEPGAQSTESLLEQQAPVDRQPGAKVESRPFDHGELNIPLAKRGNIDREIDRHVAAEKAAAENHVKDARARRKETEAQAKAAVRRLSPERLAELGKPYKLTPNQALTKLLNQASITPDAVLKAMEREGVAQQAPRPESQNTLEQETTLSPDEADQSTDTGAVPRPDARGVGPRPDFDPGRTRQAKLGIESLVRRFGGSTVADSINRSYAETGRAELIGQQISSDADLAALAEVYRNPAFETIRYVYVNDDGNVLGETAVSMREPGTTAAFPDNMGGEDGAQWVMRSAPKGATGVWLVHNHPSGNPTPSQADREFTSELYLRLGDMMGAPKLRGHVILNHTTYGRLTPWGQERPNASITKIGPDPLRNPTGAVDLLGERFVSPSEVAARGQRIVSLTPENSFGVMLLDAQGRAITLTAIPTEAFGSKRGLALLSRLAKKSGSEAVVIVGRDEQFARATPEQWSAMEASGIVFNAVSVAKDGKTQSLGKGDRFRDRKVGLGNTRRAGTVYSERVESPTKLDNPSMDDDYRAEHSAPMKSSGAPAHDVTGGGNFYPSDVYGPNGLRYYGTGEDRMDAEAYAQIRRVQGRPNNYVTIYRAVPKSVKGSIRAGDWVTTVRAYAVEHGRGSLNGDYKIQKKLVRANEIFTNGDSWLEWGYDPQPLDQEYERAKRARLAAKNSTSVESGTNLDLAEDRAEERRKALAATLPASRGTPGWNYDFNRWEGRKSELKRARADLQDKMLAWRDAQDQLAAADRIVEDAANVYRIENLMHGRVAEGMNRIERQQVEPLVAAMKDAGVKADTLEEYLYARHAKERNRQIASINGSMPDGGSGMTNAEADAILSKADKAVLEPLAKRVDAITKATRKRMLDHGLISQEQFDAMEAQYQHYVPLRGKQTRDFEADMRGGGTGRGVDGRGKPVKQAFGRGKDNRAVNILGEVVGDAQRSIILAEKARVGRAVMRLVLANPNPALWEVEPVQTERALDANGEVYERVANDWSDPSVVAVRHKGQLYRVQFTNIELAKALNNVGVDQLGTITRWAGKINRYFSAVLTKYNPAFVPVNATRDALFGLAGLAAEHGEAAALDAALHYPQAARAAFRQAQGKTGTGQWDQWVSEFAAAGGKTGYVAMPSAEDLARQIGKGALGGNAIERTVKPVLDLVGQVNDAVENALRLSAYVTLRKRGTSADAAAEYAKNLTVNFNRKGFSGSKLNAWFLFYNAALQGAHRTSKVLRSPKAMAYVGALAGAQVAAAMFAMGLEDDDGEPLWNKIPDHVKRRNLVIALPGGTVITIPMPYGFNLFTYTAGRMAGAVLNQEDKPTDRAGAIAADVLSAATESFMPVPIGEGSLGMLPTVLRIPVNVQTNRNDFGRPIRRESGYSKSDVPLASLGKPDTLEVFKLGASGLNRIGGGDRFTPPPMSWFDRAPEDLEYLLGELTGGTGKFITDVATVGQQAAGGDLAPKLQPKDIPITKRFVTNIDEQAAQASLYYERRETLDRSLKRVRAAFKEQGEDVAVKLLESSPELKGATFKRRKKEGKNGDPAGSIITTDGNPQIIPSDPNSVFALYREAEKEGQSANESIEDAFGKTPGAIFANDETRKRDASVRVYRTGKQRAQNAFNAAWLRDVVGAAE